MSIGVDTLSKSIGIHEDHSIQRRFDAFNVMNGPTSTNRRHGHIAGVRPNPGHRLRTHFSAKYVF